MNIAELSKQLAENPTNKFIATQLYHAIASANLLTTQQEEDKTPEVTEYVKNTFFQRGFLCDTHILASKCVLFLNKDKHYLLKNAKISRKFKNVAIQDNVSLNLHKCNIQDLGFLASIHNSTNLRVLDLSKNNISDISILSALNLPNLEYLDLSNNNISKLPDLSHFKNLKTIKFDKNIITHISSLSSILHSIQNISLSKNKISDVSIFDTLYLPNIKILNLSENWIADSSPLYTLSLPNILDFSILGNSFSDFDIQNLQRRFNV
jgi:hypothetical protein